MDLTHLLLIAGLFALVISQAISFAIQARTLRQIHQSNNQTLLVTQATLETALAILRQGKG